VNKHADGSRLKHNAARQKPLALGCAEIEQSLTMSETWVVLLRPFSERTALLNSKILTKTRPKPISMYEPLRAYHLKPAKPMPKHSKHCPASSNWRRLVEAPPTNRQTHAPTPTVK
jgi:hypothetical protein